MSNPLLSVVIDAADRTTRIRNRGWIDWLPIKSTNFNSTKNNVWVDPVGGACMLYPKQLLPEFRTGASDIKRSRLTEWTIISGEWEEVKANTTCADDYYFLSDGTENACVESKTVWPANQAFFLSNCVFTNQSERFVQCQFNFGQYSFQIYSDGFSQLIHTAELETVGSGYLTPGPMDLQGRMLDVLIIPYKRCEILFWSPTGGKGWVYRNQSKSDQAMKPWDPDTSVITESGKVQIYFPNGTGRFQLTPVMYESEGYYLTMPIQTAVPPTQEQYEHEDFSVMWSYDMCKGPSIVVGRLVESDGSTPFVPDGSKTEYRGKIELSGPGTWSPFVYGLVVNWPGLTDAAVTDELDITNYVQSMTLNIAENPRYSSCNITLKDADDEALEHLRRACGRHVLVRIGTDEIFWGVATPPVYNAGLVPTYELEVKSIFEWFNLPNLPDSQSWDGKPHTEFVRWLLLLDDFTEEDIYMPVAEGAPLPGTVSVDAVGYWAPREGDSKDMWLDNVLNLTGWILDDAPVGGRMRLRYMPPDQLPTTPATTFYMSSDSSQDYKTWVKSLKESTEPPEATQVWAIGCTEDTEELIAAVYIDFMAEDGTLLEESRPANWMGRPLPVRIDAPDIKTMQGLEKLAYNVAQKATKSRITADVEAEYIHGLYRYSVVQIGSDLWRILNMRVEFVHEVDGYLLRPCTYTLELIQ